MSQRDDGGTDPEMTGIAAILQGSPLTTEDVDVVYLASEGNIPRLAKALGDLEAYYLDPAGRHIEPDAAPRDRRKIAAAKIASIAAPVSAPVEGLAPATARA